MDLEKFTILLIVTLAVIFLLGYVVYLIYLLITPSHNLSTDDFLNRKSIFKLLKKK